MFCFNFNFSIQLSNYLVELELQDSTQLYGNICNKIKYIYRYLLYWYKLTIIQSNYCLAK